ncbi:hypothetical protein ACT7DA_21155 [Bacillus pacificus]
MIVDPSAKALIRELEDRGYYVENAHNAVNEGIAEVGNHLYNELLYIHESCVKTVEEYQMYIWDERAAARGEDAPLKENDHCMDAQRYFIMDEVA